MSKHQSRLKRLKRLKLFVIGVGALLVIATALLIQRTDQSATNVSARSFTSGGSCAVDHGLEICIAAPAVRSGVIRDVKVITTLRNTKNSAITEAFTCTSANAAPRLTVNGTMTESACTQSLKSITIDGGSTKQYTTTVPLSKLQPGSNRLQATWGSYRSPILVVSNHVSAASSAEQRFEACQAVTGTDTAPKYCARIAVVLKNSSASQFDCQAWKTLVSSVTLSIPCSSVMDIGVGYIYVPTDSAASYLLQLGALPPVSSVNIAKD